MKKLPLFGGIFLCLLAIVFIACYSLNTNLSPDEAFTIALINHSPWNLIKTDALDVHPPLSYLIYKLLAWPITHFTNYINLEIIYLRIWNVIFGLLSIFFLGKIIKLYQIHINYYMISIFIILSQIATHGLTLRMYQIAALFLVLELYMLLTYAKVRQSRYLWLTLLFAVACAYSHYFAAIFAGLILFYYWLTRCFHKDMDLIIKLPIIAILYIITFIPWLLIALHQLNNVKHGYWISDFESWNAIFQQSFNLQLLPIYMYLLLGLGCLQLLFWWRNKHHPLSPIMFVTLSSYLTAYLVGVYGIITHHPVLIDRYLYPMFFSYLFFILMSIFSLDIHKYFKYPIYLLILIATIFTASVQITNLTKITPVTSRNLMIQQQAGSQVISLKNYGTTEQLLNAAAKNPHYIYWIPRVKYDYAVSFVQHAELFNAVYSNVKPY